MSTCKTRAEKRGSSGAVASAACTLALLLSSSTAFGSPNYPAAIQTRLNLDAEPSCTICHETDVGGDRTIDKPFGLTLQQLGTTGDNDLTSLEQALAAIEAVGYDSDQDGVSDTDELKGGTNPNEWDDFGLGEFDESANNGGDAGAAGAPSDTPKAPPPRVTVAPTNLPEFEHGCALSTSSTPSYAPCLALICLGYLFGRRLYRRRRRLKWLKSGAGLIALTLCARPAKAQLQVDEAKQPQAAPWFMQEQNRDKAPAERTDDARAPTVETASAVETRAESAQAASFERDTEPRRGFWAEPELAGEVGELGVFAGLFMPSSAHNLKQLGAPQQPLSTAPTFGLRAAFLPIPYLGVEGEFAFAASQTDDDAHAALWYVRAHILGQAPLWRLVPFGLLGVGRLRAVGPSIGDDTDPTVYFGAGAKVALTPSWSVRLDVRDNMSQKWNAPEGILTHSPEILLGVNLVLRPPASWLMRDASEDLSASR